MMFEYLMKFKKVFSFPTSLYLLITSLMLSLFMILFLCSNYQKEIATVDIMNIVQDYIKTQTQLKLPESELQKRVHIFGHQLEMALQDVAEQHDFVLFPQEAVLKGGVDVTPLIRQRLHYLQEHHPSDSRSH